MYRPLRDELSRANDSLRDELSRANDEWTLFIYFARHPLRTYVSVGPRVTPEDCQISYSLTFGTGGAHARYSLLVDLSQSHML